MLLAVTLGAVMTLASPMGDCPPAAEAWALAERAFRESGVRDDAKEEEEDVSDPRERRTNRRGMRGAARSLGAETLLALAAWTGAGFANLVGWSAVCAGCSSLAAITSAATGVTAGWYWLFVGCYGLPVAVAMLVGFALVPLVPAVVAPLIVMSSQKRRTTLVALVASALVWWAYLVPGSLMMILAYASAGMLLQLVGCCISSRTTPSPTGVPVITQPTLVDQWSALLAAPLMVGSLWTLGILQMATVMDTYLAIRWLGLARKLLGVEVEEAPPAAQESTEDASVFLPEDDL
ncbi:MAG: hypothetical protein AB2A00_18270 [Myxococcota bacterium]